MNILFNMYKHLRTICIHKYYVGKYCFKFGLYKQGIFHDISKFSPIEFWTSVKYYKGDISPIQAEKDEKGYSMAWAHHHNKNPHHWLYWVDFDKVNNITPMRIPYKYALEAIADWIGAGITYYKNAGKKFTWDEPYEYYKTNTRLNSDKNIHYQTRQLWDTMLVDLKYIGIDYVQKQIYNKQYEKIYTDDGRIFDELNYKNLIKKYYWED